MFFGRLLSKETMIEFAVYVLILGLMFCLTETYTIAAVYTWENKSHSSTSPWAIVKEHYSQVVLLFLYFLMIEIFINVVIRLFAIQLNGLFDWVFFLFLFLGFFLLGLRHKIFYNTYTGSGVAGLQHLFRNFLFYLVIGGAGVLILILPTFLFSLLSQVTDVASVAEIVFGWFNLFISSMLYGLVSVSLTYAFIAKNKKNKYAA